MREQFRNNPGIMLGTSKPDYGAVRGHRHEVGAARDGGPGPARRGAAGRGRACSSDGSTDCTPVSPLYGASGAEVVGGLLMVGTITGILMALFLNNAGGAWDNAKKYIETGAYGGKRSDPHKAAVVGDTVGDPFKDTAGPSLHVLIKLLSTITLVLAPLFI